MKPIKIVAIVVAVLAAYPLWLGFRIWQQSRVDEVHTAEAIVVLGAAQYDGRPSPVFKARLDHAHYLFDEGLSSTIIVTGGKQEGDRFTEAEAGANYLESLGVPAEAILSENEGRTTLESIRNVSMIARERDIESVLLVSDPMHSERIKILANDAGFDEAYASWASYEDLNRTRLTKARELFHEIAALAAYELLDR